MLATILLSALVFALLLGVFVWVRTPRYRINRANVIALLELVLDARAAENDWRVFVSIPLRHDPYLEQIRQRCMDIEERTYVGKRRSGFLFSDQGLAELREILDEIRSHDP
ncbi:hypothetical protein [Marinimicrobium sp. ABcell2]|uniref:hypothetical protein n=1 Tax=Marinimicrobium sp. ABcell2 TaxID=3069751 RepID=UPI0027AF3185|nr:hypothetical protein [Marinimicrobium sp. ABcell2]MDQ2075060.1 hypothetical protein [Marinimicrobium sp. ABcell2]